MPIVKKPKRRGAGKVGKAGKPKAGKPPSTPLKKKILKAGLGVAGVGVGVWGLNKLIKLNQKKTLSAVTPARVSKSTSAARVITSARSATVKAFPMKKRSLNLRKAKSLPSLSRMKTADYVRLLAGGGASLHFNDVYKIEKQPLGQGAFGVVLKGKNKISHVDVAIKFQQNEDDDDVFEKEISILQKINETCSDFVCIDGWGRLNGKYFIAMKYIEGVDLYDFAKKYEVSEDGLVNMGYQLLDAIGKLHKLNIAHMDVKPRNIMVNPKDGAVYLIDLGLSCDTPSCIGAGTPGYTPEEILAEESDQKIRMAYDYYALSITMKNLLAYNKIPVTEKIRQLFKDILKKFKDFKIDLID